MILLDTSYLISGTHEHSAEARKLVAWRLSGEALATSAIAWTEFLSGPVDAEIAGDLRTLLDGGILEFDEACAVTAARLFNATGRKRSLRVNGMIAATALENNSHLATRNLADFHSFLPHGLKLAT